MITQSLTSVIFEADQSIETPTAVEIDTNGKLVPCSDATKFFGIAVPGMEPDVATLRTKASTGPLIVINKGLARATVTAGTYMKGSALTIDTGTGKLKLAGNDPVVAYATEDVTVNDNDTIAVFIR